ncbi:hypothetical protein B0H19DRAFT_414731 [Mycena capillaripes]|nr:hypothetical protein B0H19DRAFT_414731 [Mycena capillaripes]
MPTRYGVAEMIWETAARAACGEVPAGEPGVLPARLKPSAATQLQVVHPPTPRELFASTFVPGHHLQLGEKTKYLTVGAWYHGGRLSQADEAYLVWPVSGRMCIVSGARGARCIEELNVGTAAKAAWFVDPQESYQDKVFVLELKTTTAQSSSSSQNDGAVSAPYRTAETVAVQHEEEIIIKFNGAAAWWMDSAYEAFVSWIKGKVDQHAMLRGKGGDAKWEEAAKRMVSPLTDSETRLQVRLSEVGVSSRAPRRTRKNALPRALPTDSGDQGSKTRIKMEMHVKEEAKADNPSGGSLSNGVPAAEKINTNSGNHMSSGSPSRKRPRVDSSGDTSATKLRNLVAKRGSGSKHRPSEVTKRQVTNEEEDEWVKRDGEVATIRDWDETPSEIGLPSRAPIVSQEERTALPLPSQIRDASQISSAWKKPPTKIGPPTNASRNKPRVDSSGETPSEMVPSFAPITSSEDRNSISGLHLSRPQQMRDASASSWKKPPTKISPPIHASRILSSTPSSGRLSNNLHSTRGGNPAAQRTVTSFVNNPRGDPPPAKRQRVDTSTPTSRKKVSQSSNSEASHTPRLGDPDDTGVIIIDDDFGERIELDDLNLSGSSRSWNSQLIPDGPSTALLRRETQRQELILRRETSKDRKEVSQSSNSAPGEIF